MAPFLSGNPFRMVLRQDGDSKAIAAWIFQAWLRRSQSSLRHLFVGWTTGGDTFHSASSTTRALWADRWETNPGESGRGISIAGLAVGVSLLVAVPKMPQSSSRVPIGVSKFGPRVGEHVPDFSLRDHTGKPWTLRSIMGPKGTVIVFFRSADR